MVNYTGEVKILRQEWAQIFRDGRETMRIIRLYEDNDEAVPPGMREAITKHAKRLEEITLLLRQIEDGQSIDTNKIVGHIGPSTILREPNERAAFARLTARLKRHRPT